MYSNGCFSCCGMCLSMSGKGRTLSLVAFTAICGSASSVSRSRISPVHLRQTARCFFRVNGLHGNELFSPSDEVKQ